ncbi:reverse transcriptase domain-containing protein [Tanacetum coccineum]
MPPKDEILPAEEQPLPPADSPIANSPGYIPESDPEVDPEEDDDEDHEEDPADYPVDGGDDGDGEDEPSDDDEDEEVDIEADDEEEEEHLALADSTVVALPAIDQAPSVDETEPFETDESAATPSPHPAYRVTTRISIPAPVPTPVWSDSEVARLLAIFTPPSSSCFQVINSFFLPSSSSSNQIMTPKRTTRSTPATTTTTPPVTNAQLKALIDQGIADALVARDADRSRNGNDSHNSGTGSRRTKPTAHEFENQVKFATCTLHSVALTWWNTHVKTTGHDTAYGMPWKTLMKIMTDKCCPRNKIKKLEMKIWDLKVKGTDLTSYTQRFQELALLCGRMFPEESDKIKKYVGGLSHMIHGSVMASKPNTMQDAIEIDKKISTLAERQAKDKRKLDKNNQA